MLSKSQQPLLKHLISKADVKMRPPYGKAYEQRRRYASFIATTNNLRPLPDDKSGSRRFICIVVKEQIDYLTPINYPQLYAQLLAEIARGGFCRDGLTVSPFAMRDRPTYLTMSLMSRISGKAARV